jgi:hypothetical protein
MVYTFWLQIRVEVDKLRLVLNIVDNALFLLTGESGSGLCWGATCQEIHRCATNFNVPKARVVPWLFG